MADFYDVHYAIEDLARRFEEGLSDLRVTVETTLEDLDDSETRMSVVEGVVECLLTKIRMGTYDAERHGTLEDILEEIWRALNDRDI